MLDACERDAPASCGERMRPREAAILDACWMSAMRSVSVRSTRVGAEPVGSAPGASVRAQAKHAAGHVESPGGANGICGGCEGGSSCEGGSNGGYAADGGGGDEKSGGGKKGLGGGGAGGGTGGAVRWGGGAKGGRGAAARGGAAEAPMAAAAAAVARAQATSSGKASRVAEATAVRAAAVRSTKGVGHCVTAASIRPGSAPKRGAAVTSLWAASAIQAGTARVWLHTSGGMVTVCARGAGVAGAS